MVASFIWCLACITSIFLKILLLSLHIVAVNMSRHPFFLTYSILIWLSYIKVLLVCIMHQWVLKSESYSFFLWVWLDKAKSRKRKEKSKEGDDGGPLQQRKRSICTDSPCTDSALQGPSLRSPTPPSKVLALTWQCDIWLHVAYGVYLVMLLIRVNCIYLVYTLYMWIWHAFLFLVHTTSMC